MRGQLLIPAACPREVASSLRPSTHASQPTGFARSLETCELRNAPTLAELSKERCPVCAGETAKMAGVFQQPLTGEERGPSTLRATQDSELQMPSGDGRPNNVSLRKIVQTLGG